MRGYSLIIRKRVGLVDSGPPLQRTQANTASQLLRVSRRSGGPPPVKRHIGTMVCRHVSKRHRDAGQTDSQTDGCNV